MIAEPSPVAKERWRWAALILMIAAFMSFAASVPSHRWTMWLGYGFWVAGAIADIFYRRAVNRYWDGYAKRYPPGCTCIRGALTDNPSCPIRDHKDALLMRWLP